MWLRINRVLELTKFLKRHLRIFLLLLLGAVFVSRLLPASAQKTITFGDYQRLIGQANSQARSAIGQSPTQCRAILGQIAEELTAVTHVQFPDGTIMPVNHAGAEQILQTTPCNPQKAITYLTGICPIHICPVTNQTANGSNPSGESVTPGGFGQPIPPPADGSEATGDFGQPGPPSMEGGEAVGPNGDAPGTTTDSNGDAPGTTTSDNSDTPGTTTGDNGQTSAPEVDTQTNSGESQPESTGDETAVSPDSDDANPGTAPNNDENAAGEGSEGTTGDGAPGEAQNGDAETAVSDQPTDAPQGEGEATDNPPSLPTDISVTTAEGEETPGEGTAPGNDAASQETEAASEVGEGEEETAVSDPESPPDETIDAEETADNQTQIILIALITLIIFMLALMIGYLWYRQREEEAKRRKRQGRPASAAAAVAEGRRQIEEENYREAVRQLFLATLLALEERGILQFDKTLTNYELLHKMRGNPSILTTLRSVVDAVERVWYGFEPLTAVDYEALVTEIDTLRYAGSNNEL